MDIFVIQINLYFLATNQIPPQCRVDRSVSAVDDSSPTLGTTLGFFNALALCFTQGTTTGMSCRIRRDLHLGRDKLHIREVDRESTEYQQHWQQHNKQRQNRASSVAASVPASGSLSVTKC